MRPKRHFRPGSQARDVHNLAASLKQGVPMNATLLHEIAKAQEAFVPVERIDGALDAGAIVICDHASNALPPGYGSLGLSRESLDRHIAYDIGAAAVTRRLAALLGAPALLSTFSRLLIDPNRGTDDPTLVMRISDGAVVPGNARIEPGEIMRRRQLYWSPYRHAVAQTIDAMIAIGAPPAVISIHSFTPTWRATQRNWKIGVLWDADPRLPAPLLKALALEGDLDADTVGDNEPYDGALSGDTIDDVATIRGLANALIEVRQDLVADEAAACEWAERLARILRPILAQQELRAPQDWGSRASGKVRRRREQRG